MSPRFVEMLGRVGGATECSWGCAWNRFSSVHLRTLAVIFILPSPLRKKGSLMATARGASSDDVFFI